MPASDHQIEKLSAKLKALENLQHQLASQLWDLREEIRSLKKNDELSVDINTRTEKVHDDIAEPSGSLKTDNAQDRIQPPVVNSAAVGPTQLKKKSDLEKFIGENLINKIGIAITIIGVAIGAKYSIEHNLVSPLTRIIIGYMMGFGLLLIGIRLRKNYESFSAVLVSGAMAIMYFITYAAFTFYNLYSREVAFGLMVMITVFTVVSALKYNKQVIAEIGLVGAYAVPFLLSEGSGKIVVLFIYMTIINTGILLIAFKKYWKRLYYSAFILTWLIFISWLYTSYEPFVHFKLASTFVSIFFAGFYLMLLIYKLQQKEKFDTGDVVMLISNSFIFYGCGYAMLVENQSAEKWMGVFTLANAVIHFLVALIIYRHKNADRNLFYLVSGLVFVFITIAIPVELDGNWVTLLWASEAALLFWIGRSRNAVLYERLSWTLMLLATVSLVHDWLSVYGLSNYAKAGTPFLNIYFFSSLIFAGCFAFINYVFVRKENTESVLRQNFLYPLMNILIPVILIVTVYFAFRLEISNYWDQRYLNAGFTPSDIKEFNNSPLTFRDIWIINYTLFFLSLLSIVNIKYLQKRMLGFANFFSNVICIAVFIFIGQTLLGELRTSYLNDAGHSSVFYILIRYVSYSLVFTNLIISAGYLKPPFTNLVSLKLGWFYNILFHVTIISILSSELITWLELSGVRQSNKLGLSILWGLYSLLLISIGIWKNKKHLRIAAILLFSITLLKLFFYDISHLDTISKTIVFVALGILLLIISFLYNKYKHIIANEHLKDGVKK